MLEVKITNEEDFRKYFFNIIAEEVEKIKTDVAYGRPMNQQEIAKFLRVSPNTIREEYGKRGMPYGWIKKRKFYDPLKCKEWVTTQKIDME